MEIFYPELMGISNHNEIFNTALENYIYNSGKLLQGGYDFNSRCYYHAFIWPVVEYLISEYECKNDLLNSNSIMSYQKQKQQLKTDIEELTKILYKGPIYRVLTRKPKYDGFICHCSYDLKDIKQSYCCDPTTIYYWIIADTDEDFGFNVNAYFGKHNVDFEKEIIFPLQKKHTKEIIKGTYKDFLNYIERNLCYNDR